MMVKQSSLEGKTAFNKTISLKTVRMRKSKQLPNDENLPPNTAKNKTYRAQERRGDPF